MNTNTSTNDLNVDDPVAESPVVKAEELNNGVVLMPNGVHYTIHNRNMGSVYLAKVNGSGKDKLHKVPVGPLLDEINSGHAKFYPAGDESFLKKELNQDELNHLAKVLTAVVYHQLNMEANDDLKGSLDHENYLNNTLEKANKALLRKASANLKSLYAAQPEMLVNLQNVIDKYVKRIAKYAMHEHFFLDVVFSHYENNPSELIGKRVQIESVEA